MRLPNQAAAVRRDVTVHRAANGVQPSSCDYFSCLGAIAVCGGLFASGDIPGGVACLATNGYSNCRDCFS
jgi:hypothetical protein